MINPTTVPQFDKHAIRTRYPICNRISLVPSHLHNCSKQRYILPWSWSLINSWHHSSIAPSRDSASVLGSIGRNAGLYSIFISTPTANLHNETLLKFFRRPVVSTCISKCATCFLIRRKLSSACMIQAQCAAWTVLDNSGLHEFRDQPHPRFILVLYVVTSHGSRRGEFPERYHG